jgi:uncharacterized membrane protein
MTMFHGDDWTFWQVTLMWVFMVSFWGLLIGAVYLLVTKSMHGSGEERDDPRRTLDRRLARGEIDPDEYRRLRELLETREQSRGEVRGQP